MPPLFGHGGPKTERVARFLKRRGRAAPGLRPALDCRSFPRLFRKRAIVFTDTTSFTVHTARYGILHCLTVFDRLFRAAGPPVRKLGGQILKMEGDSLLMRFDDVAAACRSVVALEACLRRLNRGKPESERLALSYGIGYGDVVDTEEDVFGLEVNIASRLGEDVARPGEVLLTPAAAAALPKAVLRRVVPYKVFTFEKHALPIQRLKLRGR